MGPGLLGFGLILTIVGITFPITFQLGPYGKLWRPDGPADSRRGRRAMRRITVVFSSLGICLSIVGVVLTARS
jgi:hypothetical protein